MMITQQELQAKKQIFPEELRQRLDCVWKTPRYRDNGQVIIQPITCLGGNVEMEFLCSPVHDSYHPRLKIKSYFFSARKDKTKMPTRREIFQGIDLLARALGAEYAYIPEDKHTYLAKRGGHRISSRILDLFFSHQKTFYQRGWTGSFRMTAQQYRTLPQTDPTKIIQENQSNRRTIVHLFQEITIHDLSQILSLEKRNWIRTHFPQDLSAYNFFQRMAHDVLEKEDTPILIFQEAFHKILGYTGPDERIGLLRDSLDRYFNSTWIVKIYYPEK